MDDFLVLTVSAAVIAPDDNILEVQPCGISESQIGQTTPQEIGDGVKTEDDQVDTGMRTAEADTSTKHGDMRSEI